MARTVFILGAGASKDGGAPLMGEFLDVARDLLQSGAVSKVEEQYKIAFKAIADLQRVHSKSKLNIHNIEVVLSAFETARTLRSFADYNEKMLDTVLEALVRVIQSTIEETLVFPFAGRDAEMPNPPGSYQNFVDLLKALQEDAKPKHSVAAITFNYDVALDYACYTNGVQIDYAVDSTCSATGMPYLKLHGSLNWGHCVKCGQIVPLMLSHYLGARRWTRFRGVDSARIRLSQEVAGMSHCGNGVHPVPFIVPPTWSKTTYHRSISSVWARAARELRDAENIIVIGFSMPLTDEFFRYLYALGTAGDSILQRFWVVDPDTSGEVERRFRSLLGPGAEARFRYIGKDFAGAIEELRDVFHVDSSHGLLVV